MTRAELLLKRHKDYLQGEGYLVYFDNRCVGRIFYAGARRDCCTAHDVSEFDAEVRAAPTEIGNN